MEEKILIGLVSIIVIGVSAQWLAMRLKMPSILFLLIFGFISGPVLNVIRPDELFGHLLFPIISISVAIILFEGGMDLKLHELKGVGSIIRNLITIGVFITWCLVTASAYFILGLNLPLSILLGAILVVTGPTVIGPLLRHVRPTGKVNNIVKWEGIMNDPVGVVLAVLVFESILNGSLNEAGSLVVWGIIKTIIFGLATGGIGAGLLIFALKKYSIPDALHQVVTLMFVLTVFVVSNHLQTESGLLAVTFMGIVLVNQKSVSVKHILEFKENLRVLIISVLFIILAARLDISGLQNLSWGTLIFIGILFVIIRPLSVFVSCLGNKVNFKEKIFISCMAPRGIVAAAMASVFAYELRKIGYPQAEQLMPIVFIVIISTVGVYGLLAMPLARLLGLAEQDPQGVLIVGAHKWARMLGALLKEHGFKIILADTNYSNIRQARRKGLEVYYGTVFSENIEDVVDLNQVGKLFALTPNDEANALSVIRFKSILGAANVYQLFPDSADEGGEEGYFSRHMKGRYLFSKKGDYKRLSELFAREGCIKEIKITEDFDYEEFLNRDKIMPLFLVTDSKKLFTFSADDPPTPQPGQILVYTQFGAE